MQLEVPIDIGEGAPIVLLHGYAMRPATYKGLAELLARHCRVVVPDLFAVRGRWSYRKIFDGFTSALDHLGLDRVSLIGHSFGGAIELGFASRFPQRVVELVFSDTLAVSRDWGLAREALAHPARLMRLATPKATSAFTRNLIEHPRQLADAAMWAFTSGRDGEAGDVERAGVPAYVLWANRDSVLSRSDGERFADELGAPFIVATGSGDRPIDHDWMFQQPQVFFQHLKRLCLKALSR
jgi:pimeloyl-ACP methyl ester carboxylesterase